MLIILDLTSFSFFLWIIQAKWAANVNLFREVVNKNIYVAGRGRAVSGFPVTPDATQPTTLDGYDFYLTTLKNDATELY